MNNKKVLIVDDSAVIRAKLSRFVDSQDGFECVGTAIDPYVAREMINSLRPDILVLDIEMPRMDGLTFLEKLMNHFPLPVIIFSSLAEENSTTAFDALALGALEVIHKGPQAFATEAKEEGLAFALKKGSVADIRKMKKKNFNYRPNIVLSNTTNKIIALGASTGGTVALEAVLKGLPPTSPGIVITQHMPANFTKSFAERLSRTTSLKVTEASGGEVISPGFAFVAPGNKHLLVRRVGGQYLTELSSSPLVHFQRPSVDVMFHSLAKSAGINSIGVLLTGMGKDGAEGMLAMKQSGAITIAEDESTAVVYGMPKEACKIGAVVKSLPLDKISQTVVNDILTN